MDRALGQADVSLRPNRIQGDHDDRPVAPAQHQPDFLDVVGVNKRFRHLVVMNGLHLKVGRGELVSLLGPSGCGKTTLLRLIAGLLSIDGGRILLDEKDLSRLPAHKRNIGVVFQNYALFPHLTVEQNVAFGLKAQRFPASEVQETVEKSLELVRMSEFAKRSISVLSGGQQQRVAVARVLAVRPNLLLLDEPFSALDRKLRETMQMELRRLMKELRMTAIFVTHDQDEALVMSDRIAVMNSGVIEQFDEPTVVYTRPSTPFVLDFVGMATRISGRVSSAQKQENMVTIETPIGVIRAPGCFPVDERVLVAVRPEKIRIGAGSNAIENDAILTLRDPVFLGSKILLHFDAPNGDRAIAEVPTDTATSSLIPGNRITVRWPVADTLVYSTS